MSTIRIKTTVSRSDRHKQRNRALLPQAGVSTNPSARPLSQRDGYVDICSALFEVCRRCELEHLNRYDITCLFDVDGGTVPGWMYATFRSIVEMLLADIAADAARHGAGGIVNVTLRRNGPLWALAVAEGVSGSRTFVGDRRLAMLRALTHHLDCVCRLLPQPHGTAIAIAIPETPFPSGVMRVVH